MPQNNGSIETSLIIPVFNQWTLTKQLLPVLAQTLGDASYEILLMDNGSTDATQTQCQPLGSALFGERFRYQRSETNRNFGPASNLGARLAKGRFLLFLNNDTLPQPGWYRPLLEDFATFTNLGATGPLLLYPPKAPFGYLVQHLGVCVSPFGSVQHLYEGIPAQSPLAKKRRFPQLITAACMLIPRELFFAMGLFDEHYVNGVEDIHLCMLLTKNNYRLTVNPNSCVVHYTSQTEGRYSHETENYSYFATHCKPYLTADLDTLLLQDGLRVFLTPWLGIRPALPTVLEAKLNTLPSRLPTQDLVALLKEQPFWENGWERLAAEFPCTKELATLFPSADHVLQNFVVLHQRKDRHAAQFEYTKLLSYCVSWATYQAIAQSRREQLAQFGAKELMNLHEKWLANAKMHRQKSYLPFLERLLFASKQAHFALPQAIVDLCRNELQNKTE